MDSDIQNRKWTIAFAAVSLIGAVFFYLAFYPGFMSPDSLDQYRQASSGSYDDWHPIAMALLWSLMLKLVNGPQLMLAFQLILYWYAAFLLARSFKRVYGLVTIILFLLAPFLINFSGYVIKDAHMALSWLMVSVLLFNAIVQNRKLKRVEVIVSATLLIYGLLVRIDALPGLLPLAALWVWVVFANKPVHIRWVYVLMLVVLALALNSLLKIITNPEKKYAEHKLFMHDLSGIFVKTGEDVFPEKLYKRLHQFDTAYIREHYHTATNDMLWWNYDGVAMQPPADEGMNKVLANAWLAAIKKHPATYLQNRLDGFWYYLRIKVRPEATNMVYYQWIHPNDYGFELKPNGLRDTVSCWIDNSRNLFYMQAWFWMLLNLLLFIPVLMIRSIGYRYVIVALLFSSLLFRIPQVFIYQIDTDFRYFYWTCIACTFAALLIIKAIRTKEG